VSEEALSVTGVLKTFEITYAKQYWPQLQAKEEEKQAPKQVKTKNVAKGYVKVKKPNEAQPIAPAANNESCWYLPNWLTAPVYQRRTSR